MLSFSDNEHFGYVGGLFIPDRPSNPSELSTGPGCLASYTPASPSLVTPPPASLAQAFTHMLLPRLHLTHQLLTSDHSPAYPLYVAHVLLPDAL